jgi:hypothetical protein
VPFRRCSALSRRSQGSSGIPSAESAPPRGGSAGLHDGKLEADMVARATAREGWGLRDGEVWCERSRSPWAQRHYGGTVYGAASFLWSAAAADNDTEPLPRGRQCGRGAEVRGTGCGAARGWRRGNRLSWSSSAYQCGFHDAAAAGKGSSVDAARLRCGIVSEGGRHAV